jgi:hypothetical protein
MSGETSATELLEATSEFLRAELLPGLGGRSGYLARVALNALAIAAREAAQGEHARHEELARLHALLGREGDRDTLQRELCARIRHGEYGCDDAALMAHLWATARARLAIDNPAYVPLSDAASTADASAETRRSPRGHPPPAGS